MPSSATSAAASADVNDATLRQRLTLADISITLEGTTFDGTTTGAGSTASATTGGACSGSTSGACGSACPIAALIFSQTSGRGSTDPTIWLRTPSLCSHATTIAVKSLSTDIMVSTCARSSASRVPSAYSAASAIWSSL